MRARRAPAIVMSVSVMVMRVFMVVIVGMMMVVPVVMIVGVIPDPGLTLTATAYCVHHSTSSSLTLISSPPVTCNW
jgi:hypothetical protein